MPKTRTFPTLYDEVIQLRISRLKEWGYLHPNQIQNGTVTWSRQGEVTDSISIRVNTLHSHPFVEVDYKVRGEKRIYQIPLVSIPSNLGKGKIWYFLCPSSQKRCKKLYSIGGYFLHREAFKGCMYESQAQSKQYRFLEKHYGAYFRSDSLYEQLNKKHFKKTYAGKPTKKYLKIMKQIKKVEGIPLEGIQSVIYGR